ncbi:unnamed protein product [Rotaria sordida]|uniref:Uncharacterized protein n=1 Tax=Rotaria sordida TaxID=392033 RepID=A0A814C1K6_9BILA|nr:unnamed protein product [Rotaria sordida]
MSRIKIFLLLLILSIPVINGRALRKRRQATGNTLGQDVNNLISSGYNIIRNHVVPAVSSVSNSLYQNVDRYRQNFNQGVNQIGQNWDQYKQNFNQGIGQIGQNWDQYRQNFNQGVNQIGQNWDQYKQNFNQGINQFTQGWNQFRQNYIPQFPYPNNNNYYGYNQYGYNPQQYPYPMNYNYNYPRNMYRNPNVRSANPYVGDNFVHGRGLPKSNVPYYPNNFAGQQRSNEPIASNSVEQANQIPGPRSR